jgi:AhpC/TSA family protein
LSGWNTRMYKNALGLLLSLLCCAATAEPGAPTIGRAAPEFSALDSHGHTRRLSDFAGRVVVLEWTNAECPFTRKHYTSGNMQSLQALAQKNDVIWLSVISSAAGKQGYVTGPGADELSRTRGASPAAVLLDPSGSVGRLYTGEDDAASVRDRQEWCAAISRRDR